MALSTRSTSPVAFDEPVSKSCRIGESLVGKQVGSMEGRARAAKIDWLSVPIVGAALLS